MKARVLAEKVESGGAPHLQKTAAAAREQTWSLVAPQHENSQAAHPGVKLTRAFNIGDNVIRQY
jgi:hypothetical protein